MQASWVNKFLHIKLAEIENNKEPQKNKKYRWLRRMARTTLGVLIVLILLLLFIRSPWGQSIILDKAISYVKGKTGTDVQLNGAFITWDGDIRVEGLYLGDVKNDTLLHSKSLEANIALLPLIKGTGFEIDDLEWDGLTARIKRADTVSGFNYEFLMDAFATAPDTTASQPLDIKVGTVNLTNFDIIYQDEVEEMDASVNFEELFLEINALDLDKMIVDFENLTLKNALVNYEKDVVSAFAKAKQDTNLKKNTNLTQTATDTANDSPLPLLKASKIRLDNVVLNYNSKPDGVDLHTDFGFMETSIPKANVENNDILISYFNLENSKVAVHRNDVDTTTASVESNDPTTFQWPDMKVALKKLNLKNNTFLYTVNGAVPSRNEFHPDAVSLQEITVDLSDFNLRDRNAAVTINELKLKEISGLNLNDLRGSIDITDQNLDVSNLNASVNNSSLSGNLNLGYPDINSLIHNPESLTIQISLPQYYFNLSDVYAFMPELAQNEYVSKLAQKPLNGKLMTSGSARNLKLDSFIVNWGASTFINASGNLQNATDVDQLFFNIDTINAVTTRATILNFIKEEDLGITFPENARLNASASGTITDLKTKVSLATSYGAIALDGSFKNDKTIKFKAGVKLDTLNLNKMLAMEGLGDLSLEFSTRGSGKDISTLDAVLKGKILEFSYNDYPLKNIPIEGKMKNGKGDVSTEYRDDNINVSLTAGATLDTDITKANAQINVVGVDLRAFGITSQHVKAAGKIDVSYEGDEAYYLVNSTIANGIAVLDNQSYLLDNVDVTAFVKQDSTAVDIHNKMLDLELRSNVDPQNLTVALERHMNRYLTTSAAMDTAQPVVMNIKGNISPAPILRDVILPGLQALDTINIAVDFDEKKRILNSDVKVAYFKYGGSEVDSLVISSVSDAQNLKFQLGFNKIASGPVYMKRTALTGVVAGNKLNLDFTSYDKQERLIHLASTLSRKRDQNGLENLIFNLSVDDLILNKQSWTIPSNNEIAIGESKLLFNNFKLTNQSQSIELRSDRPYVTNEHVALLINNFRLQGLLSFLNSDQKLATGKVNGEFVLDDIYGTTGFIADLQIADFHVMETPLGILKLDAKSLDAAKYDMNMSVKGEDVDILLDGDYEVNETAAKLNLNLDVNKVAMTTLTGVSDGFLKDGSGAVNGTFKVAGTTTSPEYNGILKFNNATASISMLDTSFTFKNEEIKIDNAGVYMNHLSITDVNDNPFTIDGTIGTENLLQPTLDLDLKAVNFTALHSTAKDNDLYYGKATFDASAKITGNTNIPIIDLDLTVKNVTDLTYVVPETELDVVKRDGIVQFVNKVNPDAILTQTEEESATVTGFDITANFKVRNDAKVTIIIDPDTGDQLQVSGDGDFKYRMTPNGRMTLAGRYEISEGFYEFNLYDIVSRRFDLAKGGSVTWSGDPFDANLDVSAIYKVETSASAIMASQTSGADLATQEKYRQRLPFMVYLNIDGELLKPEISFKLDLPEDEKGALGGEVYSRLQQVNTQDQELNKQVFSLLVLNKFFPTSGADGSNGGTATIARDNLNQALSDQLNQYGGQLLGKTGIDFNFGLDSYTDYASGSGQERTQLDVTASKKLLDDRLIVSVGSEVDIQGSAQDGEEAPVIGNVSLEYLLTQAGQWRLKGFRRNQYDNVVDGQLLVSGISLIFTKEFNEFKNLFTKTVLAEKQKARKEEEEELKKNENKTIEEKKN